MASTPIAANERHTEGPITTAGAEADRSEPNGAAKVETHAAAVWHVLHTRSRQEKAVAELLDNSGVEWYLPLYKRVRVYGHRKRVVEAPLFPSYVFMRGQREQAFDLISNKRVVQILPVRDQKRFEHELEQIRRAIDGEAHLDPYPYLREGVAAVVRSGPLKGVEGIVESRTRCDRLILCVQTLGRAVAIEMDAALLEVLD